MLVMKSLFRGQYVHAELLLEITELVVGHIQFAHKKKNNGVKTQILKIDNPNSIITLKTIMLTVCYSIPHEDIFAQKIWLTRSTLIGID